jgi:hypothetical protein
MQREWGVGTCSRMCERDVHLRHLLGNMHTWRDAMLGQWRAVVQYEGYLGQPRVVREQRLRGRRMHGNVHPGSDAVLGQRGRDMQHERGMEHPSGLRVRFALPEWRVPRMPDR